MDCLLLNHLKNCYYLFYLWSVAFSSKSVQEFTSRVELAPIFQGFQLDFDQAYLKPHRIHGMDSSDDGCDE